MRVLRAALRHFRAVVLVLAVAIAVTLVTTVTIDVGPLLKARAERAISAWLERPTTIGRLGIQLARGRFVVEDLRIEGLLPGSEPWLVASRIEASLTWGALVGREVLLDTVEMTDWRMVAESYADGRQSFPRVTGPPRPPREGPALVVTTLQYVHAHRGEFVFLDHGSNWSVIAPNIDITVGKLGDYRGTARFSGGTLTIQDYLPMAADMQGRFRIEGPRLVFDAVDLVTDGARSEATGEIDVSQWPEQTWQVRSRVQFPDMRPIFFKDDDFTLSGEGDFAGTFHLYRGGRRLEGDFTSAEAGVNDYRFPDLRGSLVWVPEYFEVTRATSRFYGGDMEFSYAMRPLGAPRPARVRFDVTYRDVDLTTFTDFLETSGLRLAGRASGRNLLEWPLGAFRERTGDGEIVVTPPAGVTVLGRALPEDADDGARRRAEQWGPFSPHLPRAPVPFGGEARYRFDPARVEFAPGHAATPETFVAFSGVTEWGERTRMPFHVTSVDWQASDRLLSGIMTAFGAPTTPVPVDGVGQFDGVMLESFREPRIEGTFSGREMRAWDVTWGRMRGEVVVDNAYASVSRLVVEHGHSRLHVDGQFSLGYPRRDGGEEIDARIRVEERPVGDFQQAFNLEDYPIEGAVSGDFHLYGRYERPYGFGRVTIDRGVAYDEPFATASAGLRFEGGGVRLDGIEAMKGGGVITGAAFIGWNGTYSFNADGRRLAVETLQFASFADGPVMTGLLDFSASGSGQFNDPRYEVRLAVRDLFVNDEGIGQVTGRLSVRDILLTFEVEAASPRLAVSGAGRLALTDEGDAEMSFRATDTSLDPYVRAFAFRPDLSPFTTAVASGTIRIAGEIYNPDALRVDTTIEQLDLRFFDYQLRNAGPIQLALDRQTVQVNALRLVGDQTELDLVGTIDLAAETLALTANGDANFAVLQGLLRDVRSAGRTEVAARIDGPIARPLVSGTALVTDARLRHFSLPHALEAVNGIITFNTTGVRLDAVTARLAGGDIRFGGRIGLNGFELGEFDVTAAGEEMRLRFPEGMRSLVDASLALQGPPDALVLSGQVLVRSAIWTRGFDATGNVFGLGGSDDGANLPAADVPATTVPLAYDVRISAPSTLRIDNDQARIIASADLELRGTFDRPLLFGRADIERGEARFEGRRYVVTQGSLDFTNPVAIQPFFDVEAETRVRVPGQTYRVTLRMAGTTERMQPEFTSDPPLPPLEILTLLFSDSVPGGDVELASLRSPNQREQELLQARATRALTGALSAEVGRVVEQTFGVDTFQITPLLVDPYQQSSRLNVNPTARVTIGKRLSDRVFLTYARSLSSSTRDEIILLEYDQSDTLAWVFSQNEDRTYALEVRKRVTF